MTTTPEELDLLAQAHERRAADLRAQVGRLTVTMGATAWEGPAAERARCEHHGWLGEAELVAGELELLGRDLRHEAAVLREERAQLAAIERRFFDLIASGDLLFDGDVPSTGSAGWWLLGREHGLC
jgi:hypothetical protein